MNQHLNKKNIEAAVRVAFANPNTIIYVSGSRSNKRYSVVYYKNYDEMLLMLGKYTVAWAYTTEITKQQKSKEKFIGSVAGTFCDVINDKIKAA